MSSKWISINDAVPHHDTRVLTLQDDMFVSIHYGNQITSMRTANIHFGSKCYITHWMPLPPPPAQERTS